MLNLEKCNLSAKTCEIDVGEKEWTGTLFQGTCSLKLIKFPLQQKTIRIKIVL